MPKKPTKVTRKRTQGLSILANAQWRQTQFPPDTEANRPQIIATLRKMEAERLAHFPALLKREAREAEIWLKRNGWVNGVKKCSDGTIRSFFDLPPIPEDRLAYEIGEFLSSTKNALKWLNEDPEISEKARNVFDAGRAWGAVFAMRVQSGNARSVKTIARAECFRELADEIEGRSRAGKLAPRGVWLSMFNVILRRNGLTEMKPDSFRTALHRAKNLLGCGVLKTGVT
jgi:hypothetical protein